MSGRPVPLALYAAATALAEPLAPTLLRRRARRGKEDPHRLGERLGRASLPRPTGPLVWLHGVSVGESLSLIPLVKALQARRPGLGILVTSGTTTSAAVLAKRLPPGVLHQFAPVDAPGAVRRFLDHWRPDAGLLVESELWPNLILAAQARGVRLALVSARMTAKSAEGWRRTPASAQRVLRAFEAVLPQDADTEARLGDLGATTGPRLNLKLVSEAPPADPAELDRLRQTIGARPVILAASTHPGEEPLIVHAVRQGESARAALLIVAPRHPDRADEIAAALAAEGLRVARRSQGEGIGAETDVYLADTLGEFGLLLRLASVVVMGGSFVPGVGGHNPLEAAQLGAPIVTGPHVFNAAEIYAEMRERVAAIEAADPEALVRHLEGLLANPAIRRRVGEAGLDYAARQGEAFEAALTRLEPLLPA